MAGSRLERIGTIFSRASGLLRTGVMKPEDKPIWYDVYAIHPPHSQPRYDREAPNIKVKDIFYEEDIIRAKFHKVKRVGAYNFADTLYKTQTQDFIDIYKKLKAQGPLDDDKVFETALEKLIDKQKIVRDADGSNEFDEEPISLLDDFKKNQTNLQQKLNVSISRLMK